MQVLNSYVFEVNKGQLEIIRLLLRSIPWTHSSSYFAGALLHYRVRQVDLEYLSSSDFNLTKTKASSLMADTMALEIYKWEMS